MHEKELTAQWGVNFKYIPAPKVRSRFPIWVAIINSHQRWNRIDILGYIVFPVDFERLTFQMKGEKNPILSCKKLNTFQKQGTRELFFFFFFFQESYSQTQRFRARRIVQGHLSIHVLLLFVFLVRFLNICFTSQRDSLYRLRGRWWLVCTLGTSSSTASWGCAKFLCPESFFSK